MRMISNTENCDLSVQFFLGLTGGGKRNIVIIDSENKFSEKIFRIGRQGVCL